MREVMIMKNDPRKNRPNPFFAVMIILMILGIVIFLPARTIHYWQGTILWSIYALLILFITVYFGKKNPELLARRVHVKEKTTTKKPPAFLQLCFLCYVIPGFDFRFHWSTVPVCLVIAANAAVLLGYVLIFFVFRANSYASTIVQVEDKQKVSDSGPYGVIRHPMYLGLILMVLFTPLALGSYWALIPASLIIPLNVMRIKGEEEVLLRELPGYREYCLKTPYRLLPLIW